MTAKEIQKRNIKSNQLKVMLSDQGKFFVESSKGKILYNVVSDGDVHGCTCGDYARNAKKDPEFKCKHILAVENSVPEDSVESTKFLDKNTPKLKDIFLKNIHGKDFVLYAGVLDLATQKGLLKLEVELLQYPTKDNGHEAICGAIAEDKNGKVFSDIGDANPGNCTPMIAKHLIRMASTRAKGRCLRDMCNIGIACLEELDSLDDIVGGNNFKKTAKKKVTPAKAEPAAAKKETVAKKSEPKKTPANKTKATKPVKAPKKVNSKSKQDMPSFSEAQKRAIYNLSRRNGISVESLDNIVQEDYGKSFDELSSAEASDLIRSLQQAA
jgi:hypothetical protein